MTYRALPAHLHSMADHVRAYLARERGVVGIAVEQEVHPDLSLRPTLHGRTRDHHLACVEVTDAGYTDALDAFVLDCQRLGLPTKLLIAVPAGNPTDIRPLLRRARLRGVGVLEVQAGGRCTPLSNALSLSLTGVRRSDNKRFPVRYLPALSDAEDTFLNGDPVKGCSRLYDEIEALTRRLAGRATTRGLFVAAAAGTTPPNSNKGPWKQVLEYLRENLDYQKIPGLTDQRSSPEFCVKAEEAPRPLSHAA